MRYRLTNLLACVALCASPSVALFAQSGDQCGDILVNGVFKDTHYSSNSYLQQLAYSRFASSSYDETRKNLKGDANIPVGEMLIGGSFSKKDYELRKRDVQKEDLFQFTSQQETDVAMHVADEGLMATWLACMKLRGGLIVTSRLVTPKVAKVTLSWTTPPNSSTTQTKLVEFGVLPSQGIEISTGKACTQPGWVIDAHVCEITVALPKASDPVVVSFQTENGAGSILIPARMKLETKTKRLSDSTGHVATGPHTRRAVPLTLELPAAAADSGWLFDLTSVRPEFQRLAENCFEDSRSTELDRVSVTWILDSNHNNSAECRMYLTAQARLVHWVPMY